MKLRIVNESGRAAYVSSVQFVRIPLGGLEPDEFLQLADAEKVAIEVDHPELGARALIARPLASALARDIREN